MIQIFPRRISFASDILEPSFEFFGSLFSLRQPGLKSISVRLQLSGLYLLHVELVLHFFLDLDQHFRTLIVVLHIDGINFHEMA